MHGVNFMKIIISPAKKMNFNTDTLPFAGMPVFLDKTNELMKWIQSLSYTEVKKLWNCNDKIALLNFQRFQKMNLNQNLTPAMLSYEGIQYQYMAPAVFEAEEIDYLQKHLRILSGFYGVLKPLDGIRPYRLEMQTKVHINEYYSLYQFWSDTLYQEILDTDRIIVNLASQEYSKCISAYLCPEDHIITCIFGEMVNGRVLQKGTLAKMARGEMVRFMASHKIETVEEIQNFSGLDYHFCPNLSTNTEYVFLKK